MENVERAANTAAFVIWHTLLPVFVLGIIGHILNFFILTQPNFRSNPCTLYFLASNVANCIIVWTMIPLRILQNAYNIAPANYSSFICKTQYFVNNTARALASWFLVLACIDRYFRSSSNVRFRRLSNVIFARYAIVLLVLIMCIAHIHVAVFNVIDIGRIGPPFNLMVPVCNTQAGFYRAVFSLYWFLIVYALCPPMFMFIFGVLTIFNIRQQHRRIWSTNPTAITRPRKRKYRQMLVMLSVQCIVLIILTTPLALQRIYNVSTASQQKSNAQRAIDQLFLTFVISLAFLGHASNFYLFTLTSSIFRKELIKLIDKVPKCNYFDDGSIIQVISNQVVIREQQQVAPANENIDHDSNDDL